MPRLTRMGSRTVQSGLYRMEQLRANPQQLTAEVPSAAPSLRRDLSERAEPPHPHRPPPLSPCRNPCPTPLRPPGLHFLQIRRGFVRNAGYKGFFG